MTDPNVTRPTKPVLTQPQKIKKPEEPHARLFDTFKLVAGACGAVASLLVGSIFGDSGTLIGAATGSIIAGFIAALFEDNTRKAGGYITPRAKPWQTRFRDRVKFRFQWKRPDLPNGVVISAVCLVGLMGGIALGERITGFTVHGIVTHTKDRGSSFTGSKVAPPATPTHTPSRRAYQPSPAITSTYHYVPPTVSPVTTPASISPSPTISSSPSLSPTVTSSASPTVSSTSSDTSSPQPINSVVPTPSLSSPTLHRTATLPMIPDSPPASSVSVTAASPAAFASPSANES